MKELFSMLVPFSIASATTMLLMFLLVYLPLVYIEGFMYFTALVAPSPLLLVACILYVPAMILLTCWWGFWSILRLIEKKVPLKELFYLLCVLWLPVTCLPLLYAGLILIIVAAVAAMIK